MIQVWYILRIKYSNEYFIFFRLLELILYTSYINYWTFGFLEKDMLRYVK